MYICAKYIHIKTMKIGILGTQIVFSPEFVIVSLFYVNFAI